MSHQIPAVTKINARNLRLRWPAAALMLPCIGSQLMAQALDDYPKQKPVVIVSPTGPGASADILARLATLKMTESGFAKSAIVENRPGAGGNLAAQHVKRAAVDGYTLLIHSTSLAINPSIYASAGYDTQNDFIAVALVARTPNLIAIHPALPANNLAELLALSKKQSLSYASSGIGTTPHLSMERLKLRSGTASLVHVPYQPAAAVLAGVSGEVQVIQTTMPPALPQVQAVKLRAIAVTSAQRSPLLPDVPTVSESGFAGFDDVTWFGFFVPARTPPAITAKLNAELNRIFSAEDVKTKLGKLGLETLSGNPGDFASMLQNEIPKWAKAVKESGAKVE